jgi:hypothetical protein
MDLRFLPMALFLFTDITLNNCCLVLTVLLSCLHMSISLLQFEFVIIDRRT